jgi:hypothetical protein
MSNPAGTSKQTPTEAQMLKGSRRLEIRRFWGVIRWKMLLIFGFFSLLSVGSVSCLAIAVLNVVIRRENAYLIEERIKVILENWAVVTEPVLNRVHGCDGSLTSRSVTWLSGDPGPALPGIQTVITRFPKGMSHGVQPLWLSSQPFGGLVEDRGRLEIRFVRIVREQACSSQVIASIPLDESMIGHVVNAARPCAAIRTASNMTGAMGSRNSALTAGCLSNRSRGPASLASYSSMNVEYAPSATACRDETLLRRSVGDLGCSSALHGILLFLLSVALLASCQP